MNAEMKNVEIICIWVYLCSYAKAKVNDGRRNLFIGSKKVSTCSV